LNKLFEVLVWSDREEDGRIADADRVITFETYNEAHDAYHKITKWEVKMLMKYDSMSDDADGDVMEEDWREEQ